MAHRNRWFTWVYLLKMLIFHGYVNHNQMVPVVKGVSTHSIHPMGNVLPPKFCLQGRSPTWFLRIRWMYWIGSMAPKMLFGWYLVVFCHSTELVKKVKCTSLFFKHDSSLVVSSPHEGSKFVWFIYQFVCLFSVLRFIIMHSGRVKLYQDTKFVHMDVSFPCHSCVALYSCEPRWEGWQGRFHYSHYTLKMLEQ